MSRGHEHRDRALWGTTALIFVTVVGLATGCGNLTAGGLAEATVTVSGDAPDAAQSAALSTPVFLASILPLAGDAGSRLGASARRGSGAASRFDDDEPEGEVEVAFEIFLVTGDGEVVPLGDREIRVRVDIPGQTEARPVRRRTIPAGTYSRVRVVFTEIEAEVDAGLVIDGTPILGPVEVELEADSLAVEAEFPFEVAEGGELEVLLDLNASTWLRAANPDLQTVAEQIFRDALQVRLR